MKQTTTAITQTVFKKIKPALTSKQQLQAIAIAMQQKAMAEVAEYNKKELEQIKLINELATKQFQLKAQELVVTDFCCWTNTTFKVDFVIPFTDKLKEEFDKLQTARKTKPRVLDVSAYISQLRNAQVNNPENNVIAKLLESPEIVNKLAAFGKDLVEGAKNKQAIIV